MAWKIPYTWMKPLLRRVAPISNPYNTIVHRMSRLILSSSTYARPNSMIRVFSNMAALVRYRNDFDPLNDSNINGINGATKPYDKRCQGFLGNIRPSFLKPSKFISNGAYGAVWSATYPSNKDATNEDKEMAVKVLYNYYAATDNENDLQSTSPAPHSSSPDGWHLMHLQKDREVNLRPPADHANIVPIVGASFDRAPPSKFDVGSAASWEKVEEFPEGFRGRPPTWYFLMPLFEGSLDSLLSGKWQPICTLCPDEDSASQASTPLAAIKEYQPTQSLAPTVSYNPPYRIPPEEAVGVMAQIFEAVAELERCHIAHRDLRPSNILVNSRQLTDMKGHLNMETVRFANQRLHAALTDFGCAVPTVQHTTTYALDGHSGVPGLLAPEVAAYFSSVPNQGSRPSVLDYSRADLWAAATIAYPLFGRPNPFFGELDNRTYSETELPMAPPGAPGVIAWLLSACLRRDPSRRPTASMVADVLHVWCILRQAERLLTPSYSPAETFNVRQLFPLAEDVISKFMRDDCCTNHGTLNDGDTWLAAELSAFRISDLRKKLCGRLRRILCQFIEVNWSADWLLGPAQSGGLRCLFYRRVTLQRFVYCLALARYGDVARLMSLS